MATRFRLFAAPRDVRDKVLGYMAIVELFEVSQMSQRAFDSVTFACFRHKPTKMRFYFNRSPFISLFYYENPRNLNNNDQMHWEFYAMQDPRKFSLEGLEHRIVRVHDEFSGRLLTEIDFAEKNRWYRATLLERIEELLQFVQYISTLFNATVSFFHLSLWYLHHMEAIQSVEVLRNSGIVHVADATASHDVFRRLLGGFEAEQMVLKCTTEPDFGFLHPIRFNLFRAWDAYWFTGPMLLNLDCEIVTIDCKSEMMNVSDEDINTFLHEFMNSDIGCGTISLLALRRNAPWNLRQIVEGLVCFDPVPLYPDEDMGLRREFDDRPMRVSVIVEDSLSYFIFRDYVEQPERMPLPDYFSSRIHPRSYI